MIKIYGFDVSTPANKVRYVANYLNIEYEYEHINALKGEHQTEEHRQRHPAGKVPVIIDGDFVLFESNAIIRYLADKVQSSIYPKELKRRAQVDQWLDYVGIHINNAMTKVFGNRVIFPYVGIEVDERSLADGLTFLDKFLPAIEQQLSKHDYLVGNEISLADFNLIANLEPAELADVDLSSYPKLVTYRDKLHRESFYQTCHEVYGAEFIKAA